MSPWWIANVLLIFYTLTKAWMHMNVRWRLRCLDWLFGTFTNPDRVAQSAIRYGIGEKVPLARLAIGV